MELFTCDTTALNEKVRVGVLDDRVIER